MMSQCPKCGFTQPKDRFCANCGVDMETYTPPEKTITEKVTTNRTVHFAIVLLILILGGVMFYQRIQQERSNSSSEESLFERITSRDSQPKQNMEARSPSPQNHRLNNRPSPTNGAVQPTQNLAENNATATEEQTRPTDTELVPPKTVQFKFGLLNVAFLDQSMSNANNQAAELNIYSVPTTASDKDFLTAAREQNQFIELPGGRNANFELGSTNNLSFLFTNPEIQEETGISIEIEPTSFERGTIQWVVKTVANLTGEDGTLFTINTEDLVASENGAQIIIFGIIPRTVFSEADLSQFEGTPLQAAATPEFQSGDAEVVLVISPEN